MYRLDPIKTYNNNNIFSKVEKSKVTLENLVLNNFIQYQNKSTIVYLIISYLIIIIIILFIE